MGNQKKKNTIAYIIIGLVLGLSFVGAWVWYLCTLPDMETQLMYSPFCKEGTWICKDEGIDFEIISDESDEVKGIITTNDERYDVRFSYVSTRGFSHRYAVVISMTSVDDTIENNYISFTFGGYDFKEESFTLKNLNFTNANKVTNLFNEKIDLHFNKVS